MFLLPSLLQADLGKDVKSYIFKKKSLFKSLKQKD